MQAYDHALGVKVQNWSNGGTLMSVGSFDEVARIFNTVELSWSLRLTLTHLHSDDMAHRNGI